MLLKQHRPELPMQIRNMIRRRKNIVVGEPRRPKSALHPTMPSMFLGRIFSRNIKIHHADPPARPQNIPSMVHRREPVRYHRQRIRKGHCIDGAVWGRERRCIGFGSFNIFPTMISDSPVGNFKERARKIDDVDFSELLDCIAEKMQIRAGSAAHIHPNRILYGARNVRSRNCLEHFLPKFFSSA